MQLVSLLWTYSINPLRSDSVLYHFKKPGTKTGISRIKGPSMFSWKRCPHRFSARLERDEGVASTKRSYPFHKTIFSLISSPLGCSAGGTASPLSADDEDVVLTAERRKERGLQVSRIDWPKGMTMAADAQRSRIAFKQRNGLFTF